MATPPRLNQVTQQLRTARASLSDAYRTMQETINRIDTYTDSDADSPRINPGSQQYPNPVRCTRYSFDPNRSGIQCETDPIITVLNYATYPHIHISPCLRHPGGWLATT